jgi:sec-independent protein translocase protein TatC
VARLRSVRHDEELSLVEHLDELRTRLVVVLVAFGVVLAVCFWQNHYILEVANRPLGGIRLVTLGIAEQFTTTLMVSAYAALLLTMPLLLHQAYAFLLPAFSPSERRVALPLLLMVPVLFLGGVVFGYYVILPQALSFLLGFNADEFRVLPRAREYYSFAALSLLAVGVLFQIPVGVLAATRLGLVTTAQLRRNRRYAILVIAVVAMLLPGTDPVTMLLAMAPLLVLYELSILLAVLFGRSRGAAEPDDEDDGGEGPEDDDPGPGGGPGGDGGELVGEAAGVAGGVSPVPARTP